MKNLTLFDYNETPVRVVCGEDGEPWWVAADVCRVLEIKNSRDGVSELDEDQKGVATADTLGGRQKVCIISESGLYTLIFKSRKPEAKVFRRWVTKEVLPAIRKTGRFASAAAPVLGMPSDGDRLEAVQVRLFAVMAQFMAGTMTTADLNAATNWAARVHEGMDRQRRAERSAGAALAPCEASHPVPVQDGSCFWQEILALLRENPARAAALRPLFLLRKVWLKDADGTVAANAFDQPLTGSHAAELLRSGAVRLKVLTASESEACPGALLVLFMDHQAVFAEYRARLLRMAIPGIGSLDELRAIFAQQPWNLPGWHSQRISGEKRPCFAIALENFPFAEELTRLLAEPSDSK